MIVYIILCERAFSTGMGGHYFSMLHLVKEMENLGEKCEIVCFGDMRPGAFTGQAYSMYERTDAGWKSFEADFKGRMSQCRIIHCYGDEVTRWVDNRIHDWGIPVVTTKPGRKPFAGHNRRFRNMIFFTASEYEQERRRAFLSPMRYNLALIPQRISKEQLVGHGRRSPFSDSNAIKILRIGRFVPEYAIVVQQSVNLARQLRARGREAEISVVGTMQDVTVFDELQRRYGNDTTFLTDEEFTFRAAELIGFADIVVGVGRGAMEAVMMRKPTFVSGTDPNLPIFLDQLSFDACFANNFSTRTEAVGACEPHAAFERFFASIESETEAERHLSFLDEIAREHFDAAVGAQRTLDYYATCRSEPSWMLQRLDSFLIKLRHALHRRYSSRIPLRRRRCGCEGGTADADLLAAIRADLARSPWSGEGHRKAWGRLRILDGLRISRKRVLRLMRENTLLSPHRVCLRPGETHDRKIVTEAPNVMWAIDATQVTTARDGKVGSSASPSTGTPISSAGT
ncbi:MAG: hypothetical protein EA406_10600 [Rhodospirillales bacterium]|nr:MAG: hypothetical protein EA406_10600 [Rhodospirillales bacterium]